MASGEEDLALSNLPPSRTQQKLALAVALVIVLAAALISATGMQRVKLGRPLVELRETFQLLGIERVNQTEPEDRIATLCETMAGLVGGPITGPDGCDRDFFAKHLATSAR